MRRSLPPILNALLAVAIAAIVFEHRSERAAGVEELVSIEFVRGDANDDGLLDLSDPIFVLGYLFLGGDRPPCRASADINDDGFIEITDPIYALAFLFQGGPPPAEPYPLAGVDPTADLGCREPDPPPVPGTGQLGGPDRVLDTAEYAMWIRGRELFDHPFERSAGLGPHFNGDSCRGCHLDPLIGGSGGLDVDVVRFAIIDDEGRVSPLPGGPAASRHAFGVPREELPIDANLVESRQTPALFGLGLVDRIPEREILVREDPQDLDGDGISGRARRVGERIGRFGHKAGVPSLRDFTADALLNEIGITVDTALSAFAAEDDDAVADPELDERSFDDLAFFLAHLAPPPRRLPDDDAMLEARIARGEELFTTIGCASCHTPELAGADGPVRAYSDFLLHEDGVLPHEFRTAPLWGCSMSAPYMHDGSAETLVEAIWAHDREARDSRIRFENLAGSDRGSLIDFLESL